MEIDFGKLQQAAADLAHKAADGVQYVAHKGRQAYDRLSLENELGKAQRQLGAYYYNQVRLGADHTSAMSECIARIDGILEKLAALEEDAKPADCAAAEPSCPACGAKVDEGAVFCSKCGEKL